MNLYKTLRESEMLKGGVVESILAAESEEKARRLTWLGDKAEVKLIGTATEGAKEGVILSYWRKE